jgi:hypothetical protein
MVNTKLPFRVKNPMLRGIDGKTRIRKGSNQACFDTFCGQRYALPFFSTCRRSTALFNLSTCQKKTPKNPITDRNTKIIFVVFGFGITKMLCFRGSNRVESGVPVLK